MALVGVFVCAQRLREVIAHIAKSVAILETLGIMKSKLLFMRARLGKPRFLGERSRPFLATVGSAIGAALLLVAGVTASNAKVSNCLADVISTGGHPILCSEGAARDKNEEVRIAQANSGAPQLSGGQGASPNQKNSPIFSVTDLALNETHLSIEQLALPSDFTFVASLSFAEGSAIDQNDAIAGDGIYQNGNDLNFFGGQLRLYASDGSPRDVVVAKSAAEPGNDYNYVVVRRAGVVSIYMDGRLEARSEQVWNSPFRVSKIGGGIQSGAFAGRINHLAIHDRAFSEEEVLAAFPGPADSGNQGTMPMNAPQISVGQAVYDPEIGATIIYSMPDQVEVFGSSGVVSIPPSEDLQVSEGTVVVTFKPSTVDARLGVFSKDANGFVGGDHMRARIEDGVLKVKIENTDGISVTAVSERLSAGESYHLAVTFGADGIEVYLDGKLLHSDGQMHHTWLDNTQYLHLGADGSSKPSGSAEFSHPFQGTISDILIFENRLSDAQVRQLVQRE